MMGLHIRWDDGIMQDTYRCTIVPVWMLTTSYAFDIVFSVVSFLFFAEK